MYDIRTHSNDSSHWLFTGFTSCDSEGWTPLPKTSSSVGSLWIGQTSVHPSLPTMTIVTQILVLSSSSEPESLRAIKVQAGPRKLESWHIVDLKPTTYPCLQVSAVASVQTGCAHELMLQSSNFSLSMMISPSLINCTLVLPITSTCVNLLSERAKIDFTALRHNCFSGCVTKGGNYLAEVITELHLKSWGWRIGID